MISKQEFVDWKNHPVTKYVIQAFNERIDDAKNILATSAGIDPLQDRWYAGSIAAYGDILNVQFEENEE